MAALLVRPSPDATRTAVIDAAGPLGKLTRGTAITVTSCPAWEPHHRPSLVSVVSGTQWPHARKAAVPKWRIADNRCLLCETAVGTLMHRYRCPQSTPEGGWPVLRLKLSSLSAGWAAGGARSCR